MKEKEQFRSVNKAITGVGAVLLLLVLNLAFGNPLFNLFFGGAVRAGTRTLPPPSAVPDKEKSGRKLGTSGAQAATSAKVKDEFARFDSTLNLGELKEVISRPAPQLGRNPFELEAGPKSSAKADQPPPAPPPPPPPPPIRLKVVGYAEKPGGGKEAYVCETREDGTCLEDKEVYIVHEGEEFGNHFRATKVTPQQVEVEDQSSHQTAQLLMPQ
jgi:hypothetical protein